MINQVNLPKDKELAKQLLDSQNEIEKQKINQGFLGKIWGNSSSIPNNIAALSAVILITVGIFYTCAMMNTKTENISLSIKDFWSIISPLITLSIGFLFGDSNTKEQ